MMNIEQLAIEHELMDNIELYGEFKDNEMLLKARREKLKKLEAFAKAYAQQQSEPVAWQQQPTSEDVKSALLFCLWHHQGHNSKIGQPIRRALGIMPTEIMTDEQCEIARRVQSLFTQPPTTVPLEQYNKLLDAMRWLVGSRDRVGWIGEVIDNLCDYDDEFVINQVKNLGKAQQEGLQAIAEAERSDK